jgi:hypothetical protein
MIAGIIGGVGTAIAIIARVLVGKTPAKDKMPSKPPKKARDADVLVQVNKLVAALTDNNGDPLPSSQCAIQECEGRFKSVDDQLKTHSGMHRKHFKVLGEIKGDLNEILDHVTNGGTSSRPKPNYDIDAEDTGQHNIIEEE